MTLLTTDGFLILLMLAIISIVVVLFVNFSVWMRENRPLRKYWRKIRNKG